MRTAAAFLVCAVAALLLAGLIFVFVPLRAPRPDPPPRPEPSSLVNCELTADCGANAWRS
jgi:hypothetical protein